MAKKFDFSIAPEKKRVSLGGTVLGTTEHPLGEGTRVIGSAGVSAGVSVNLGVTPDRGEAQHDSIRDTPLPANAMGFRHARRLLNEVVAETGGDLGKYTLTQFHEKLQEYPLTKPATRERIDNAVATLNATTYTPPPNLREAQQVVKAVYDKWKAIGSPTLTITNVDSAIKLLRPDEPLTGETRNAVQAILNLTNGNIEKAYEISQNIPDAAFRQQNLGALVMPMTLAEINAAATQTRDQINARGGITGTSDSIVSAANTLMNAAGHAPVSPSRADAVTETVVDTHNAARRISDEYARLPSQGKVQRLNNSANKLAAFDPEIRGSVFVAGGVIAPDVSAALVAEKAASVSIGNIIKVAGSKASFHPAFTNTTRIEVGKGTHESVSFSPETSEKLNLTLSGSGTHTGAYAFAKQDATHWAKSPATLKTTTLGIGASISHHLGGSKTGILGVEAGSSHSNLSPGDALPQKSRDTSVTVKAGIKF